MFRTTSSFLFEQFALAGFNIFLETKYFIKLISIKLYTIEFNIMRNMQDKLFWMYKELYLIKTI